MGRAIEAGRVWVNCYHSYPAHAAFGGYKNSGIGRETALKLARWGAVVFSGDIDADGNATTVELSKPLDGNILAINLDITNEDSISSLGKMLFSALKLSGME